MVMPPALPHKSIDFDRESKNRATLEFYYNEVNTWSEASIRFSQIYLTSIIILSGGGLTALIGIYQNQLIEAGLAPVLRSVFWLLTSSIGSSLLCAGLSYLSIGFHIRSMRAEYDEVGYLQIKYLKKFSNMYWFLLFLGVLSGAVSGVCLMIALVLANINLG